MKHPAPHAQTAAGDDTPLLQIRELVAEVSSRTRRFDVLRGVDLTLRRSETIGVAGESGSGKTMLALSVLGLLPKPQVTVRSGAVVFEGTDLTSAAPSVRRALLGNRISAVFQDPLTSLNPLFTIGDQIGEVIRRHTGAGRRRAAARSEELLEAVHIPEAGRRLKSYPHELSGGQRQRVAIAMAIANEPSLLIADEPTTALDVTVQAEILDLLAELRQRMGMSMLFITHDLGVIEDVCDRVVVMYAGRIVEQADTASLFAAPLHPYTRRLMECVPRLGHPHRLRPVPGMPPPLHDLPSGCAFHPRCDIAEPSCRQRDVTLSGTEGHQAACIKPGDQP